MEHSEAGWAYGVIYDDLNACGCGSFDDRMNFLRESLRDFPLYQSPEKWGKYIEPPYEWFLCLLDGAELIEHGGSLRGSWLAEKGRRLKAVLENEAIFQRFLDDDGGPGYCMCDDCKKERQ